MAGRRARGPSSATHEFFDTLPERMNGVANTAFHDPLIIPVEGGWLGLSTDLKIKGVQARRSDDLLAWSDPYPLLGQAPASVRRHTGVERFWAPELVERNGKWRLYVCASRVGTTQSVIGLAEADDPLGPYAYIGDVLQTNHGPRFTQPNAIDPCVCAGRDGRDYLFYGSFFGGIHILPLTEEGFPAVFDEGQLVAGGGHQPIEGAYCVYHEPTDRFVLFTSWGSLRSDYHIRVGYSHAITGPYLDSNGYPLTDPDPVHTPGDKLVGGYHFGLPGVPEVMATGHNSIARIGGEPYVVHHARPEGDERRPFLQIRRLFFAADGRAMAWPLTYDGAPLIPVDAAPRRWRFVHLSRDNYGVVYGVCMAADEARIRIEGSGITARAFCKDWKGFVFRQGDRVACTLLSPDGEALWGIAEA